ncbi:hypothetical protein LCGC14_0015680 [marine sediment metagenome]|uniref:PFL domain-containing protein n=1 Tax=marine sediment metagenome TaxID=412755 RepID=A0A0F9YFW5_9ZZZZ
MSPGAPAASKAETKKITHTLRLAEWFEAMVAETPISVATDESDHIVGPSHMAFERAEELVPEAWGADGFHCPFGTKQLMELGFAGIASTAAANAEKLDGQPKCFLQVIARCYEAACRYAQSWSDAAADAADAAVGDDRVRLTRIADACSSLGAGPPDSLLEAAQLLWFGLAMRNGSVTSPPGRLDQYLQPFYVADLARGEITPEFAQQLIDELFTKIDTIFTGDGLMNLVVGGVDADGNDATNEMSMMMLDAATRLVIACPQMNIRIHDRSPEAFRRKATELQLAPTGGCSILNDEVIIPAMVAEGIPLDLARNYCCDGCNELLFDGESLIDFTAAEAAKSFERALFNGRECPLPEGVVPRARYHYAVDEPSELGIGDHRGPETGDFTTMTSFDELFEAFQGQYLHSVTKTLDSFCSSVLNNRAEMVSAPFFAGTFPECLATGEDPMTGGARWQTFMIFSGSIPTAADGLAAVKKVVFEDHACTPGELLAALEADWEGYEPLRKRCMAAPRFGNDDPYVDDIAAEIVRRFDTTVREYKHELGFPLHPALFCHTFNMISMALGATPDGRRRGDAVAEHFSPVPGRALSGPTAVINSMTKAPIDRMVGTAVTHISLSRAALGTPAQASVVVRTLVDTALKMGLTVINLPIYDVQQMIDAQKNPEQHADLMVRVWGFSDRFNMLDSRLQDHLIARALTS